MGNTKRPISEELIETMNEDATADNAAMDLEFDMDQLEADFKDFNDLAPPPPVPAAGQTDKTLRIVDLPEVPSPMPLPPEMPQAPEATHTKVSFGAPVSSAVRSSEPVPDKIVTSGSSTLKQTEHLRIAQNKINSLEEEIVSLRREMEAVGSAGETFKKINDEYYTTIEVLKDKVSHMKTTYTEETQLLKKINKSKEKQIADLKRANDEMKSRLDDNFRNVRNREKDLEHRLEIAKIEEMAVVKSKDQLILDLKRKIDRIQKESENFRSKSQQNYKELHQKNQVIRGVVRALKIALTKMEGDFEDDSDLSPVTEAETNASES